MYADRIKSFPKFAFNMAMNQSKISFVRKCASESYPDLIEQNGVYYWTNSPGEVDPMICKYPYEGKDICSRNKVVGIAGENTVLLNKDSGELLHDFGIKSHSIFID